jgi:tRNA-specific 2-thiouridylase
VLSNLEQQELKRSNLPSANCENRSTGNRQSPVWQSPTHPTARICVFVDQQDYHKFLRELPPRRHPTRRNPNYRGRLLGMHQGLAFYTIGQRKGLPAHTEALYVLEKRPESNT